MHTFHRINHLINYHVNVEDLIDIKLIMNKLNRIFSMKNRES